MEEWLLILTTDKKIWRRSTFRNIEELNDQNDKIKSLESENKSLKADLSAAKARSLNQQVLIDGNGYKASKIQLESCKRDYARVAKARDLLETKCRRYKEIQKEWREYCETWVERNPGHAAGRGAAKDVAPIVHSERVSPNQPAPPRVAEGTTHTPTPFSVGTRSIYPLSEITETSTNNDSRPNTANGLQTPGNDQTFDPCNAVPRAVAEGDDDPLIVSERSLKRKPVPVKKEADITIHDDDNVKGEPASSSPVLMVSSRPLSSIQDGLDLDDVGRSVDTPRKRRRLEQMRLISSLNDVERMQTPIQYQDVPQHSEEHMLDGILMEKENVPLLHDEESRLVDRLQAYAELQVELTVKEQEKRRRKAVSIAEQNALNDRVHKRRSAPLLGSPHEASAANNFLSPQAQGSRRQQSAQAKALLMLRSKNPNVLPRTSTDKSRTCPPSRRDRGTAHLTALAEDGEDPTPSKRSKTSSRGLTTLEEEQTDLFVDAAKDDSSSPHHRLGALLHDPSPEKTALPQEKPFILPSKASASSKTPSVSSKGMFVPRISHTPITAPVDKATPLRRPESKAATTEPRHAAKPSLFDRPFNFNGPPEVFPEHEPLRVRSLDSLRLTNFKLNKNHSEFAFHESIRKHDEKKKVGGCTDPFCERCKEVAKFAELTNFVAPEKHGLFDSSPPDPEAAEERILEEFLGRDKHRLRRMNANERKELLKKAREKSFADMYGKHRQAHPRAVSPPGYWETEFPSTQQEAENREAAKAIDKERIKERYHEALRGGVWKFADE